MLIEKIICGSKNKFEFNCQAVAEIFCGESLDMSIPWGGALKDCLAFEANDLYTWLENGLLNDDTALFEDYDHIDTPFTATPFPSIHCRSLDD